MCIQMSHPQKAPHVHLHTERKYICVVQMRVRPQKQTYSCTPNEILMTCRIYLCTSNCMWFTKNSTFFRRTHFLVSRTDVCPAQTLFLVSRTGVCTAHTHFVKSVFFNVGPKFNLRGPKFNLRGPKFNPKKS